MEELNIYEGLGVTFLVLSFLKFIVFWFNEKKDKGSVWLSKNWGDYPIHLFITWLFFFFEHDILEILNPILERNSLFQIPHPENKGFLFVLIPVFVSIVLYPLIKKLPWVKNVEKAAGESKTMEKYAPHVHNEYCPKENHTH